MKTFGTSKKIYILYFKKPNMEGFLYINTSSKVLSQTFVFCYVILALNNCFLFLLNLTANQTDGSCNELQF